MEHQIVVADRWMPVWQTAGRRSGSDAARSTLPREAAVDAGGAQAAMEQLVARAFSALDASRDPESFDADVLAAADEVLDQRAFHELRGSILSTAQPVDVLRFVGESDPPTWLLDAVGPPNEAALRLADLRMRQVVVASFESLTFMLERLKSGGSAAAAARNEAIARVALAARADPLWYLSDRSIPWPVRSAMLSRDRVDVFAVAVLATGRFDVGARTLAAILSAWIESATQFLALLSALPGVSKLEGVEPLDMESISAAHAVAAPEITRSSESRRLRRAQN